MVRVSGSRTFTAVGEQDLLSVPDPYVAYLRRLRVTNLSASAATVKVIYYSGAMKKEVLTVLVPAGSSASLREDELPLEGCPTKVAVSSDQQPYAVDYSAELE